MTKAGEEHLQRGCKASCMCISCSVLWWGRPVFDPYPNSSNGNCSIALGAAGLLSLSRLAPSSLLYTDNHSFNVILESLLIGHEDWVHSVHWRPKIGNLSDQEKQLQLLTTSMDRTMIIWEFDEDSRLWMNKESVGDAGSSALGYFGGTFSPDGQFLLSHGFTGVYVRNTTLII